MGKASEDLSLTAQARKRRMARRAKKPHGEDNAISNKKIRLDDEAVDTSDSELSVASSEPKPSTTLSKDALAKIPGVKKQARYVPAINMSRDELTMWRKEARRVRNRESAAASRQKTQKRITELEGEVGCITSKYQAALNRIVELEAAAVAGNSSYPWRPSKNVPQHEQSPEVSSPVIRASNMHTVSPPLSPRDSFSLYEHEDLEMNEDEDLEMKTDLYPHPPTYKISRHNACVKIPNRVVVAL
jgi:hypothetical protein